MPNLPLGCLDEIVELGGSPNPPPPQLLRNIFTAFYNFADWMVLGIHTVLASTIVPNHSILFSIDACLIVSTSIGIASLVWSSKRCANFPNHFLRSPVRIRLRYLLAAYASIKGHTRQSTAPLFATFPALVLFIWLKAYSVPRGERIIARSARPFYDTIVVGCLNSFAARISTNGLPAGHATYIQYGGILHILGLLLLESEGYLVLKLAK
ncbi:MAG: hypothetical protein M1840_002636 [Geoglossum simile]|nr:MAG: hypothetical protein M1840_002636 [Geoglossum simile]